MPFNPDKCLSFTNVGPEPIAITAAFSDLLQYSFDGNEWTFMGVEFSLGPGDKVYLKGSPDFETHSEAFQFDGPSAAIELGGNVMSLLGDESGEATIITKASAFSYLFAGAPVINIPEGFLPAVGLSNYCYESMFARCEQLVDLPGNLLPAASVPYEAYMSMFYQSGVSTIGENFMAATSFGQFACWMMFSKSQVASIPATLFCGTNISTGATAFASMFSNCNKLTTVPAGLFSNFHSFAQRTCEGMFENSEITEIPAGFIPEIGIGRSQVFGRLFAGTKITKVPQGFFPEREGSNQEYTKIFAECSELTEIHVPFTGWGILDDTPMTVNWVKNVAESGDFYSPKGLEKIYGDSYIPTGWKYHVEGEEDTKVHGSVTFVGQVRASIR